MRTNVDKAFSEILIKIKELKDKPIVEITNEDINTMSPERRANKKSSTLSKEEEKEIKEHSMRKRIKKFYRYAKKKCILL